MTTNTIERVLFEVASSPERASQYKAAPDAFLSSYPLAPDEVNLILQLDVREIVRRGLNPMLVLRAFNAIEGREMMPEYFRRIREV